MSTPDTMTVRVRDVNAEARWWGHGPGGIVIRSITIASRCPAVTENGSICGAQRGKPYGHNFCDDGEWANVDRWDNPCGHPDFYHEVIREAEALTPSPKRT